MVVDSAGNAALSSGEAQDDSCSQSMVLSEKSNNDAPVFFKNSGCDRIRCDCNSTESGAVSSTEAPETSDSSKSDCSLNSSFSSISPEQPAKCCLKQRCGLFLETGWLSDVTLIIGEGEQRQKFYAHKVFLASGSDVFKTMFCKNWSESGEVKIPDVEPSAFSALLRYLYTDEFCISLETVAGTLYAAKKYSVLPLENYCFNFLMDHLSPENAFAVLTHASLYDEERLIDACLKVIDHDTEASVSASGFLDVDSALLIMVLERDFLSIREADLFQAVLSWSKAECERKHLPINEVNQEEVLATVLPFIRFPLMTIKEIASIVAPASVMAKEDLLSIYTYLSVNPKPSISFNTTPRVWEKFKVNRFQEVAAGFDFQNDLELGEFIIFQVSHEVQFRGVGLFSSTLGPAHYSVDLILRCFPYDDILQQEINDYMLDGTSVTFEACFKNPVKLKAGTDYRVFVKMKGPPSFYGKKGVGQIEVPLPHRRTVTVTFSSFQPTKKRRTNVHTGQIPELIFTT